MTSLTTTINGLIDIDHLQAAKQPDVYFDRLSSQWLDLLNLVGVKDYQQINQIITALFELGKAEQKGFWVLNERMKYPLQKRMAESQGGGEVVQLLRALQVKVLQIKPPEHTFFSTFKNMFKLLFSWHQSAFQLWLESYPQHKKELSEIVSQLEQLKRQLKTDNTMLLVDQNDLTAQVDKLENCFDLLCRLEDKLKGETAVNCQKLIDDEFLPPVQQRIIELQQQLLIARQAVMTLELFIHENESQLRSIDQAVYTTTSVIDVTTGIVMVQQSKENLAQINENISDHKKLKQARQLIDNALKQMDDVRNQAQKSADELNVNSPLVADEGPANKL